MRIPIPKKVMIKRKWFIVALAIIVVLVLALLLLVVDVHAKEEGGIRRLTQKEIQLKTEATGVANSVRNVIRKEGFSTTVKSKGFLSGRRQYRTFVLIRYRGKLIPAGVVVDVTQTKVGKSYRYVKTYYLVPADLRGDFLRKKVVGIRKYLAAYRRANR
ncbi:hypothetical protein IJH89_00190 [Candidatus Saccharibacteria bacterium]|nr:hypothetical protein [Candidatus Saccharibacteria bacterium]